MSLLSYYINNCREVSWSSFHYKYYDRRRYYREKYFPFVFRFPRFPARSDQTRSITGGEDSRVDSAEISQTMQLHALCRSCRTIFKRSRILRGSKFPLAKARETYELHAKQELEAAVRAGCHFCALVNAAVDELYEQFGVCPCWINLTFKDGKGEWGQISISVARAGHSRDTRLLTMMPTRENKLDLFPPLLPEGQPTLETSTSSRAHMDLARRWIRRCRADHVACNRPQLRFKPTRLLEVTTDGRWIYLRTMEHSDEAVQYTALSHCWGGAADVIALTKATRRGLEAGVSVEDLPKSFRHAASITLGIKLKYLWIDSLCIFQDSADDWMKEAADMDLIYENATCTISAVDAPDSHHGIFTKRDVLPSYPCLVAGSAEKGMYVRQFHFPPRDFFQVMRGFQEDFSEQQHVDRNVEAVQKHPRLPLFKRAWVLQEQMLSRRNLLYTNHGLYWKCLHGTASEHSPDFRLWSEEVEYKTTDDIHTRLGQLEKSLSQAMKRPIIDFHRAWFNIVGFYTICRLTRGSDKLIALSAIARRAKQISGFHYAAGLWEETLIYDLQWRRYLFRQPSDRPSFYRAPSWSWASVDGRVEPFPYASEIHMTLVNIISVKISTHDLDTEGTGAVQDAALVLEGRLLKVTPKYGSDISDRLQKDFVLESDETDSLHLGDYGEQQFDTCMDVLPSVAYLLPITIVGIKIEMLQGLILAPKGVGFERIGHFTRTQGFSKVPDDYGPKVTVTIF